MKIFISLLLTFTSTHFTFSQTIMLLWPDGRIPNYRPSDEVERWDTAEIVRIGYVQKPDIAIYLPPKRAATGQAIVVCPGGGYARLAYDWEGIEVAKWLNSYGIAAFVLKYRLPLSKNQVTPHLSPLMDAKRAIRMVRANAVRWNIQPDQVGVMGFSAGGHLASTLGTHFDEGDQSSGDTIERHSSRPDFMILMYPVITMNKPYMHGGSRDNLIGARADSSMARLYSNELQVTTGTPPTFIVHSTDDAAVPVENSLAFFQALKNHAIPAEMHIYPYGGHGFGLARGRGYLETWTDRCIAWLRWLKEGLKR